MQDKGFSNKQIKLIIRSPELLMDSEGEVALTNISLKGRETNINSLELAREISLNLQENFYNSLLKVLDNNNEYSIQIIEELRDEITNLRKEFMAKREMY